jgi:ABC-type dipeptide/oligopeptide/nickel transport system permease component
MATFLVKRAGSMIVILLVLSAVVFVLQRLTPTDPIHAMLEPARRRQIAAERHNVAATSRCRFSTCATSAASCAATCRTRCAPGAR